MKRALIGGFISLIGSIWTLAILIWGETHLVSQWYTPPGRLLTTLSEQNLMPFFVLSILFVILGMVVMIIEFFRKEK